MITTKIRLHGTVEELSRLKQFFLTAPQLEVLCVSDFYPDRGGSKYYRCYMEVLLKPEQ
ncbi:MAG: hypothetical protein J6B04_05625 [Clostridia bacterium]|nr:hypothetical protein [Clostridia bacterium]